MKQSGPSPASPAQTSSDSGGTVHWGLMVSAMYVLLFCLLTVPVIVGSFSPEIIVKKEVMGVFSVYKEWIYWAIAGVIGLSQYLFLRVPVRLAFKKPVSRRSVWLPIFASGFWLACLVWGLCVTLIEGFKVTGGDTILQLSLAVAAVSWALWGVVFWRLGRTTETMDLVQRQRTWLLRGSILELLIAVPAHIVARGRADCCAGFMTFCGITMGISVMLLSFGPAVFLLYLARRERLKG